MVEQTFCNRFYEKKNILDYINWQWNKKQIILTATKSMFTMTCLGWQNYNEIVCVKTGSGLSMKLIEKPSN